MLFKTKWNEIKMEWINTRRYHSERKKIQFPLNQEAAAYSIKPHDSNTMWANEVVSNISARNPFLLIRRNIFHFARFSPRQFLSKLHHFLLDSILRSGLKRVKEKRDATRGELVTDYTTEKESVSTCLHKWFLFVYIVTFMFRYHQLFNSHLILYSG